MISEEYVEKNKAANLAKSYIESILVEIKSIGGFEDAAELVSSLEAAYDLIDKENDDVGH